MATEAEVLKEQEFVTDRISTQVRTIALSMIAVAWLFLSGGGTVAQLSKINPSGTLLFACILVSFIVLLFDYLQYIAAYWNIITTFKKGLDSSGEYKYEYIAFSYMTRVGMFWLKQGALVVAVVLFGIAMLKPLL